MTVTELVDQLVLRAGNRSNQATILQAELEDALINLENSVFHPWFLLSGRETNTTTAQEERVKLPANYIAEYEEGALWIVIDGQKIPLTKVLLEEIQECEEVSDQPYCYAITGDFIRLYPTPDAVYTLEMLYYKKSGALADGNVWLKYAPHYLMYQALETFAETTRDKKLLAIANKKKVERYNDLLARHTEVQMTNRDLEKGD